jgi:hypothetical protein
LSRVGTALVELFKKKVSCPARYKRLADDQKIIQIQQDTNVLLMIKQLATITFQYSIGELTPSFKKRDF